MNRRLKLVLILSIFDVLTFHLFAQAQEILPVKLKLISGNVHEILDGRGARGGVCIGQTGVLLIDAKMDKKSVDETIEGIRKVTDKPIKYLINTHSDWEGISALSPLSCCLGVHDLKVNSRQELTIRVAKVGRATAALGLVLGQSVPGAHMHGRPPQRDGDQWVGVEKSARPMTPLQPVDENGCVSAARPSSRMKSR